MTRTAKLVAFVAVAALVAAAALLLLPPAHADGTGITIIVRLGDGDGCRRGGQFLPPPPVFLPPQPCYGWGPAPVQLPPPWAGGWAPVPQQGFALPAWVPERYSSSTDCRRGRCWTDESATWREPGGGTIRINRSGPAPYHW